MLKRILLFFILLFISLFVVETPLYSQEPPVEPSQASFEEIYADYVESVDEYNEAHGDYLLRRSQYLKFQSLKSKQDAFDATLEMLQKRDDVVISYLDVLEVKLEDGVGISDDRKDGLYLRINDEREWFTNHRENLSTTGSLDDLVSDSENAATKWFEIDPLAYEIMSVLSIGKITKFNDRFDKIFSDTKDKLTIIREDEREGYGLSSSKIQLLDRWVFEADGRIVRSKEKKEEVKNLIEDIMKVKKSSASSKYNNIVEKLTEAKLYMNEAISFVEEIIEQLKIEEQ
jgi:hypothetical protein